MKMGAKEISAVAKKKKVTWCIGAESYKMSAKSSQDSACKKAQWYGVGVMCFFAIALLLLNPRTVILNCALLHCTHV